MTGSCAIRFLPSNFMHGSHFCFESGLNAGEACYYMIWDI